MRHVAMRLHAPAARTDVAGDERRVASRVARKPDRLGVEPLDRAVGPVGLESSAVCAKGVRIENARAGVDVRAVNPCNRLRSLEDPEVRHAGKTALGEQRPHRTIEDNGRFGEKLEPALAGTHQRPTLFASSPSFESRSRPFVGAVSSAGGYT